MGKDVRRELRGDRRRQRNRISARAWPRHDLGFFEAHRRQQEPRRVRETVEAGLNYGTLSRQTQKSYKPGVFASRRRRQPRRSPKGVGGSRHEQREAMNPKPDVAKVSRNARYVPP